MSTNTDVCRVCLVHNLNLYDVRVDLQNTYEKITREKYNNAGYPISMCYICLSVLKKCHKFIATAQNTNRFLQHWYNYSQTNEMGLAKPLSTYSVTKIELLSIGNKDSCKNDIKLESVDIKQEEIETSNMEYDDISLNDYIKIEELDLEPDYIVYDPDVKIEDTDEKKNISDLFLESSKATSNNSMDIESNHLLNNTETANDILDFNTSSPLLDDIKPKFNCNNKDTAELKTNVNPNPIKKKSKKVVRDTKKKNNESNGFESKSTIKKEKYNTDSSSVNIAVTNNDKEFDVYKYCTVCNLKCVTEDELEKHMRLHDITRPHVCDVCGCRFGYTGHLYNHKATIHGIGKVNEYFCDKCDFKTVNKLNLTRHLTTHTGEKPFSCNVCDFKCRHKGHLKIHMRIHTGEKPFSCHLCDYKSAEKGSLNSHMKRHTGEKPFSCDFCSYKCFYKSDLNKHKRIHTGAKPYSCNFCDFKCIQKSGLNTHMTIHTGIKPYSCHVCHYKCVNRNTLKRHLQKHLNNNKQ